MRDVYPRQVEFYRASNGQEPFSEWLVSIQDQSVQDRILARLERLESGNFGDYRSVGGGVFELRFQFGSGYRIYFSEVGNRIILLLCAGDKSSQTRDIERAKTYWLEYKGAHL
ncbi:MAG: type II toxin-antitoxin system RelE/ParE family toxin [Candidatus Poribacteria bacterium]|nr:type II toxin-antitoxin system RelE/ParE family toxin [Candidatus Poribacteria bacterium]